MTERLSDKGNGGDDNGEDEQEDHSNPEVPGVASSNDAPLTIVVARGLAG
jgi:hypothetical protein